MKKKRLRRFTRETGAIIDYSNKILHLKDGEPSFVNFSPEIVWKLHTKSPGVIYALSHVHPPQMKRLSYEDETTLRVWTTALFPFPIRMITICEMQQSIYSTLFVVESCYLGILESKDSWKKRGKDSPRKFQIIQEYEKSGYYNVKTTDFHDDWYGRVLLERSYIKNI